MAIPGALTLALALAAGGGGERVLLCRPKLTGDPALARGEVLLEAAKQVGRFLDYGVPCEDAAEGARAARRVGLAHAVSATAEGRLAGSRYELVLAAAADETERARRSIDVAPGADAAAPLRGALGELLATLPADPAPPRRHVGAWTTFGAGVASLAAGVVLAFQARSAADDADSATDPAAYAHARERWSSRRAASGWLLGAGVVAAGAGLTWRYAF
jgi:hypothetical protein